MNPDCSERFVHNGEVSLNLAEWSGDGPPVLMIHGWGEARESWDTVAPRLARDYHVYALDLRGFGRSGRAGHAHPRMAWVTDVARVMENISPDGMYIVGHSLGGWVAMMLPSVAPGLVMGIVAEDPYTGPRSVIRQRGDDAGDGGWEAKADALRGTRSVADLAGRLLLKQPQFSAELATRLATMRFRTDPDLIEGRGRRRDAAADDFDSAFAAIDCPALVLQANPEKGGIMPDAEAERLRSLIPRVEVVKWSHTGHNMHVARNFDFVKTVRRFFSSADTA